METATAPKTVTKWNLDAAHSEISFKVKHMMIANVSGSFQTFSVNADSDADDFTKSKISFTADINSINTGSTDRDKHLKSNDFFNAESYPQIKFVSRKFEQKNGSDYTLTGDLTIKDVTKTVELDVEFGGIGQDPWGNPIAWF